MNRTLWSGASPHGVLAQGAREKNHLAGEMDTYPPISTGLLSYPWLT